MLDWCFRSSMQRSCYLQPSSGTSREPDTAEDRVTITSNLIPAWEGELLSIQPLFLAPSPPRKPFNQFEWWPTFHQAKTRSLSSFSFQLCIYIYTICTSFAKLLKPTHPHAIFFSGFLFWQLAEPTANGLDGLIGFRWLGANWVTKSRGWNSIYILTKCGIIVGIPITSIYIYNWLGQDSFHFFLWLKTRQVECNHLVFYDYCSIAIIKGGVEVATALKEDILTRSMPSVF